MTSKGSIFGKRLKSLRTSRKISQMAFGELMGGVSQQTICKWENGDTEPDQETFIKIADFFGVSSDYLLGRTNRKDTFILEGDALPPELQNKDLQLEVIREVAESGLSEKEIKRALRLYKLYSGDYTDDQDD